MFQSFSYTAPQGSALSNAASWVEAVLLGGVGTTIAGLAIAGLGFSMLLGHVPIRNGARVAAGCFILFGAPVLAKAMLDLARQSAGPPVVIIDAPVPPPAHPKAPEPVRDPYAGASVPQ